MVNIWEKVKEFNKVFGIESSGSPKIQPLSEDRDFCLNIHSAMVATKALADSTSNTVRGLRIKLLTEEFNEYLYAEYTNNLVEIADALADIHYIAAGTEDVYGIPGQEVFSHVHDNNMSKIGKDGKVLRRADGKVIKPEGYLPADVASVLGKYCDE